MNHEADLLQEIIDQPDDDGLRLIAADFLDENGQPERGEFIRVQVALAGVKKCKYSTVTYPNNHCCPPYCLDCRMHAQPKRYAALRRRERELYKRIDHGLPMLDYAWPQAYLPPLDRLAGLSIGVVRRGFVEEVQCASADFLTHGPAIVRATPLREVRLNDVEPIYYEPNPTVAPMWLIGVPQLSFLSSHLSLAGAWYNRNNALSDISAACIAWAKSTAVSAPETAASH